MSNTFYMPAMSLLGAGAIKELGVQLNARDLKKALIVTDMPLVENHLVDHLTKELESHNIDYACYDGVQPDPTERNIDEGLAILKKSNCDFVISFGGGSAHDNAKGIALVATNGGHIRDYSKGANLSKKPQLPLVTINTTAGTGSEITVFAIITNEEDSTKYPVVDKHFTPIIAVNDSELMAAMPKTLTAATGMDALTHAIEAYVSTSACPVTDAVAIKAIQLVSSSLKNAVDHGDDLKAREDMQYAEYLAGMAFSNASLGYVHSMSHQLGGVYHLVHGLCNAILLPKVARYNATEKSERFADIAVAMGVNIEGMSAAEAAEAGIVAIEKLSASVGTDQKLSDLGVKEDKLEFMAINALKDATALTNPRKGSTNDIVNIFRQAM